VSPQTAWVQELSALVVGRPIIAATDPRAAAKNYYEEILKAKK